MADLTIEIRRNGESIGKIDVFSDSQVKLDEINSLTTRELIDFCRGFDPSEITACLTTRSGERHQLNRSVNVVRDENPVISSSVTLLPSPKSLPPPSKG